jgi:hypothetical protein
MIKFELDLQRHVIIVHGDSTNVDNEISVFSDVTDFCINYLNNYLYRSVNQLIKTRKQEFAHVVYTHQVDDLATCDRLLQKNELVYKQTDWFTEYYTFVNNYLFQILPSANSRFRKGFVSKRDELLHTLEYYKGCKSMFYKTNEAKQMRLELM